MPSNHQSKFTYWISKWSKLEHVHVSDLVIDDLIQDSLMLDYFKSDSVKSLMDEDDTFKKSKINLEDF